MESAAPSDPCGGDGADILNVEDTGDGNANTGTLTPTTITGLDMAGGSITYDSFATLNIGLGTAGDTFTIEGTHAGTTTVNGNNGNDIFNIEAISGPTTANGGNDHDTFNVGANVGTVNDIGAMLTINGNDPTSGSDWLYVDDTRRHDRQHRHADLDDASPASAWRSTSPTAPSSTW